MGKGKVFVFRVNVRFKEDNACELPCMAQQSQEFSFLTFLSKPEGLKGDPVQQETGQSEPLCKSAETSEGRPKSRSHVSVSTSVCLPPAGHFCQVTEGQ